VGDAVGSGRGVASVRGIVREPGGTGGEILGFGVGSGVTVGLGEGVGVGDSTGEGDGVGVAGGSGSCAKSSAPLATNARRDSAIFIVSSVWHVWHPRARRQGGRCNLRTVGAVDARTPARL
jgi:hypothetical protein